MQKYKHLSKLWDILCDVTRDAQLDNGATKNPVVEEVYVREAAFSSNILATNYLVNKIEDDLLVAKKNHSFVLSMISDGVTFNEPIWTPRGESLRKGSIPATIYLFEAMEKSSRKLNEDSPINNNKDDLSSYIESCYLGNNHYAHDTVDKKSNEKVYPVLNTTLMAEWMKFRITSKANKRLSKTLRKEQLKSGLWPYLVSTIPFEKMLDKFSSILPKSSLLKTICLKIFKDKSLFFADFHHHVVTLQYFIKSQDEFNKDEIKIINNGWTFIENNIKKSDSGWSLNFSWEPQPNIPRYSNFKDSTTYFLIMDVLFLMYQKDILKKNDILNTANMLSKHMIKKLSFKDKISGKWCFLAYEGSDSEIELIFPRPAESIFHKAHLMSELIILACEE
tara:strand:- start:11392 stop:12567 length:1176 start_codon:yes stop_codon:yes gene_type:complete